MTAKELAEHFRLDPHVEHGSFRECHYPSALPGRAASGSIYYYVAPGERTEFHQIDCGEYWCYTAGEPLELWQIDERGSLTVSRLGAKGGCVPMLYFPPGVRFASRSLGTQDGTFLVCITVPRFSYEGFRLIPKDELLRDCPDAAAFFL